MKYMNRNFIVCSIADIEHICSTEKMILVQNGRLCQRKHVRQYCFSSTSTHFKTEFQWAIGLSPFEANEQNL